MAALTLSGPVGYLAGSPQTTGPFVGYLGSGKNYVLRYSFRTPSNGYITSLTFSTKFRHYSGSASHSFKVGLKVTSSPNSHINASTDTKDFDADSGWMSGTGNKDITFSVKDLRLTPNTTYYVYLFPLPGDGAYMKYCYDNNDIDYGKLSYDSIIYGLVYLEDGTQAEPYEAFIDNGSSWDFYIPNGDNGSGWDIFS